MAIVEDSNESQNSHILRSDRVNVVYIPPPVDEQSDEEIINDETVFGEEDFHLDIAGEVELEYDAPSSEEEDVEMEASTSHAPRSKSKKPYAIPQWTKRYISSDKVPNNDQEEIIMGFIHRIGEVVFGKQFIQNR